MAMLAEKAEVTEITASERYLPLVVKQQIKEGTQLKITTDTKGYVTVFATQGSPIELSQTPAWQAIEVGEDYITFLVDNLFLKDFQTRHNALVLEEFTNFTTQMVQL